jgi:putative transposase
MPIIQPQLINNEIYHIVLRGVGDALIFKDNGDYFRGIFSLYEFNTTKLITIRERRRARLEAKKTGRGQTPVARDLLVEILSFCLMPNHIHLLLKQIKDNGISQFMRKLGTGYAGYFNTKYARKGHLFQGKFRAVHIKNDEQLKNVFVYIHTNPLSLIEPNWKEIGIKNPETAIKFLEDCKWSSYPDYLGKKNFPSVTEREFILKIMNDSQGCREFVENWVRYKAEIKEFAELALED